MKKTKIYFSLLLCMSLTTIGKVNALTIINQSGWFETAYVTWEPVSDATSYNVYYSGEGISNKKIDDQLIRRYSEYFRADIPGLKAGSYTVTVKAVNSNGIETGSAVSSAISVQEHDRSGFGFSTQSPYKTSSGAYNDDGTLRSGARVIYLTASTVNTVTLDVITNNKGGTTTCTGIGDILNGYQKGYDKTPLAIRLVGKVTKTDMGSNVNSLSLLQVKGKAADTDLNITVEGIGNDATAYGWGILVRNAGNVEIRNIGFMDFPDDGVSLDTDNSNIWIHHCDFFYGKNGGGDKKKGDGSLDAKKSGWTTFSYNHFWDAGKCNLLGNGTESPEYLTYHHNWYDHSDSRHPRVRFHTVHVYNNYYDGNAKYGIGATRNSSIFSENNYFKNCKYPMLISQQGTDVYNGAKGTFSSEDGGMIKAYGNYIDGANRFVSYAQDNTDFDAYVATSRDEQIPGSIKTKKGSFTYNNFDTDPAVTGAAVYPCLVDVAADVPAKVKQYAGRIDGGDLKFTFTDADNSKADDPDPVIASAINNYTSQLIAIQGENPGNTNPITVTLTLTSGAKNQTVALGASINQIKFTAGGTATSISVEDLPDGVTETINGLELTIDGTPVALGDYVYTVVATNGTESASVIGSITVNETGSETGEGIGGGLCEIVSAGTSSGFSITGNISTSKGSVTVNGVEYTCCLKIESSTNITFTTTSTKILTLVFLGTETGKKIKINDVDYISDSQGWVVTELPAGTHTIKKGDTMNLFYINLEDILTSLNVVDKNTSVYFNGGIIYNPDNVQLKVYNMMGVLVSSGNGDINITHLERGVYLIHVADINRVVKIIR